MRYAELEIGSGSSVDGMLNAAPLATAGMDVSALHGLKVAVVSSLDVSGGGARSNLRFERLGFDGHEKMIFGIDRALPDLAVEDMLVAFDGRSRVTPTPLPRAAAAGCSAVPTLGGSAVRSVAPTAELLA